MLNNVNIIGRVVNGDLELKSTPSGVVIIEFAIANNKSKDEVNYFKVVAFNKTAQIVNQYVSKGSMVAVSGRLDVNKYQTKDGRSMEKYFITANQIDLLSNSNKKEETSSSEPKENNIPQIEDDDLPF